MRRFTTAFVLIAVMALLASCSGAKTTSNTKAGYTAFENNDFRFEYPSKWVAATDGGKLDRFNAKGIVAVNSMGKKDFWVKPLVRSELIHAGGGRLVTKLPRNGVYLFVVESGRTGEKASDAKSELKAPAKPYGTPEEFRKVAVRAVQGAKALPKEKRGEVQQRWAIPTNDWLHYRIEMINHGVRYNAHIYVLGDSVQNDKKAVESIIKSFELINPNKEKK